MKRYVVQRYWNWCAVVEEIKPFAVWGHSLGEGKLKSALAEAEETARHLNETGPWELQFNRGDGWFPSLTEPYHKTLLTAAEWAQWKGSHFQRWRAVRGSIVVAL